jgi:HEAT repeat protein
MWVGQMCHLTFPLLNIQQHEIAISPTLAKEGTHMPMTLEQLRNQLSAIEPDDSIYAGIGPSEIPLLEQLLQNEEAWIASRAVFALSRVPDIRAVTILSRIVADPRQEVRVSVAASVSNLRPSDANNILLKLLDDTDLGVRKFAVQAVSGTHDAAVHAKLRDLEARDPALPIRDVARDRLRELNLIGP